MPLTVPLGLARDAGGWRTDYQPLNAIAVVGKSKFHGFDRPIRLRHLPVFGRRVVVEIRPKRYRCPHCEGGPTTTQRCAWYDPCRPHTTAFEQDRLKRLIHSTVADISRSLGLGVKAV